MTSYMLFDSRISEEKSRPFHFFFLFKIIYASHRRNSQTCTEYAVKIRKISYIEKHYPLGTRIENLSY